jgi:ribose transport system permease protein
MTRLGINAESMTESGDSTGAFGGDAAFEHVELGGGRGAASHHMGTSAGILYKYGLVLLLFAEIAVFGALRPATFLTHSNLENIVASQAVLMIIALGLLIPLTANEFDLSAGYMVAFTASLLAVLTGEHGMSTVPALLIVLGSGVVVGLVNSFFVVGLGVNSFITTLGSGTLLAGLTILVTGNQILSGVPSTVITAATHQFLGLPLIVYYGLALAAVVWYLLEYTPLGRRLLFVGQGREAARLAGVRVNRIRVGSFITASVACAVAGILLAGDIGAVEPTVGPSYLLPAYAGAFLGATTIKPGRFNAWGTVIALYVLTAGITGLQLLGATIWIINSFNGAALLLGVGIAQIAGRRRGTTAD